MLAAVFILGLSCSKEPSEVPSAPREGIVVRLTAPDLSPLMSKATRPGDDDGAFNENVIGNSVDVFFFAAGADDNAPSVRNLRVNVSAGFFQVETSMSDIRSIFGSTARGAQCEIFVVANYDGPEAIDHSRHYTKAELGSIALARADWSVFPRSMFVMTGSSILTLEDAGSNTPAEGTVSLRRIASKVTFELSVADEIVVENYTYDSEGNVSSTEFETWKPMTGAMTVYMVYAMNEASLGGEPVQVPVDAKSSLLYEYAARPLGATGQSVTKERTEKGETVVKDVPLYSTDPFYSFPEKWDAGAVTEPYLKLIIPWNNGSRTKYYYYKVPFAGTSLDVNTWYKIVLDVTILGGEDELPLPVEVKYCVADWVGGSSTESSVAAARYLSVPITEWTLYNEDELSIPITSSHDVEIVNISATQTNYSGIDVTYSSIDASGWFPSSGLTREQVYFYHALNNDMSGTTYDIAPYTITLRVQHKDDTSYYRDITIVQRPAIVIEAMPNSGGKEKYGYAFVNGGQNNGTNITGTGRNQNTNVDGSWTSSSTRDWTYYLGSSPTNLSSSNNTNINMYVIETSVLPSTSSYILGDPRKLTVDNINETAAATWSQSMPSLSGGNRRLTYYYPVNNETTFNNFIAPTIRIASSFGSTQPVNIFDNAKRRCASYQEDGYPAGRWRLPTKAEIEFISQLNSDGKMPRLLGSESGTTYYWCNSGVMLTEIGKKPEYTETTTRPGNNNVYVRCVYDDWYWGSERVLTGNNINTFTWGDIER